MKETKLFMILRDLWFYFKIFKSVAINGYKKMPFAQSLFRGGVNLGVRSVKKGGSQRIPQQLIISATWLAESVIPPFCSPLLFQKGANSEETCSGAGYK